MASSVFPGKCCLVAMRVSSSSVNCCTSRESQVPPERKRSLRCRCASDVTPHSSIPLPGSTRPLAVAACDPFYELNSRVTASTVRGVVVDRGVGGKSATRGKPSPVQGSGSGVSNAEHAQRRYSITHVVQQSSSELKNRQLPRQLSRDDKAESSTCD
eukprot:CAMPEP_0175877042 /NCGR_PEP_ID=MMETSP0107_2-20121207/40389_1 /TAXON_ID=195067 ORGANISM="Goniomonas pacifica, Strain CCMP1869" /NCGR_SAMPLE_ID=MMETSP0107_2 /ASSEMBLY_ACC=CAM_ASM_000203 /LENGTH=156 /DNA_ID=CAMNT_0017196325 /DNA_START=107 /DNA_END=575 /DNA_ORIENTATION=+